MCYKGSMSDMNKEQKIQQFLISLESQHQAVMFDMDGTLTEIGQRVMPDELVAKIRELAHKIPVALCSGRSFEHLYGKADKIGTPLYLFCENGGVGVKYDPQSQAKDIIYENSWPNHLISQEDLLHRLQEEFDGEDYTCLIRNTNVLVTLFSERNLSREDLIKESSNVFERVDKILSKFPNAQDFHLLNSLVGIHIIHKDSDKDCAIRHFGQYLQNLGFSFQTEEFREISCFGDQPLPGFNDFRFLNGKYGTPFTVGYDEISSEYPIEVFDSNKKLTGPKGTLTVLNKIKFALA